MFHMPGSVKSVKQDVFIVSKGIMLGIDEYITKSERYHNSVKVVSETAKVFRIKKAVS